MSTVYIEGKNLSSFLIENAKDKSKYFVFNTDVVMNSWIDYLVSNESVTKICAIELERFTAWDKFKNNYMHATENSKTAIPSDLRKLFITHLISENQEHIFFKRIINPEYVKFSSSYTNYLCSLLPSLKLWYKLKTEKDNTFDDEDNDLKLLYEKYSQFLEENSFFEQAWVEPDFSEKNKQFIIIYPELLEDFYEYEETLSNNENITLVRIPQNVISDENKVTCCKYSDSRKELRRTILLIRKLVQDKKAKYNEISLCVPDIETYKPYLERELTNYCIPYVIKAGTSLTKNNAGKIFIEILNCSKTNFSYDSIRSLLLDENIPWKENIYVLKENLIREGNRLHCLFNLNENNNEIDIWELALKNTTKVKDERELLFYNDLKSKITNLVNSNSFSKILQNWIIFRDSYLNMEDFSVNSNNIISRCIVHLNELIEIEKTIFPKIKQIKINNPYEFFINKINEKTYTPQTKTTGLLIYSYKVSAAANIKYQFVIDSSQANIELSYKKLSFLNGTKRQKLGLLDTDIKYNCSRAVISLYAKSTDSSIPVFSFAENSFAGFAIVHNFLEPQKDKDGEIINNPFSDLDKDDFILNERKYFLELNSTGKTDAKINYFSENQKNQFNNWFSINEDRLLNKNKENELTEKTKQLIKTYLTTNRNKINDPKLKDKIIITQTDLKSFYSCPRIWLLNNAIKLSEDSLESSLINDFDMGNINHKILELFLKTYQSSKEPLPKTNENNLFDDEEKIYEKISNIVDVSINQVKKDYNESPLTLIMLNSQKDKISKSIIDFLHYFLKETKNDSNADNKTNGFGGYYVHKVEEDITDYNEDNPWAYYGKIDCLLSKDHPDKLISSWDLIDFKTSSLPTKKECFIDNEGNLSNFQMPTYIKLITSQSKKDFSYAGFYSINKSIKPNEKDSSKTTAIIDQNNKDLQYSNFNNTIKGFIEYSNDFYTQIKNYNFSPLNANISKYEDCKQCSFKSICRYPFTIAAKNMEKGE